MATDPQMFIRIAASVEDLKTAMAQARAAVTEAGESAKGAGNNFADLGSSMVGRITESLLLRDAIREVLAQVKELVIGVPEEAHALNLLSLQTRVNVEDLQVLVAATREYGVEGEQLGKALFQLQQRIAGGDANVTTAYHLMGLSLDEVRGKDPMALFLATEKGLGTLSGAIQDTAAKDLYGGRLGASMIAFAAGADEAVAKARALNTIASVESVKALAAYQDAVDRVTHSVHAWVMEIEGGMAQGFNTLTDASDKGATKWALFSAMFTDWTNSSTRVGAHADALATLLDHLNQTAAAGKDIVLASNTAHAEAVVALDAHGQAAKFMAALELDSAKPLLDWQVTYLGHLKDIGVLTAQNAAAIGVNADQLKNYEAAAAASAKAEAERNSVVMTGYASRIKILHDVAEASLKAYGFGAQIAALAQLDDAERALSKTVFDSLTSEKDRAKVIEETTLRHIELMNQEMAIQMKQAGIVNAAVLAELDAQTKLNAVWGRDASGAILLQATAADTLRLGLEKLHNAKVEGISQYAQEQLLELAYTTALYDEARAQDVSTAAVRAKTGALVAQAAAQDALLNKTFAVGAGHPGDGTGWGVTQTERSEINAGFGARILPHAQIGGVPVGFEKGGSTGAGGPSILHANEYVVPKDGALVMRDGGGGGNTIQIFITQPLGTPAAIAAAVDEALMARQRNTGQRF